MPYGLTSNVHNTGKSMLVNSDGEFYYPGEFYLQRGYLNLKYDCSKHSIAVVDHNIKIPVFSSYRNKFDVKQTSFKSII